MVWSNEADFNRWLAHPDQLVRLTQLVGHKLQLLQIEASLGCGRVDLLCHSRRSNAPVVIEAKLGAADLDHFGRILCYVEELGATCAIYVAESFGRTIIEAASGLPFAVHLVQANVSKSSFGDVICLLTIAAGSQKTRPSSAYLKLCSVVTLATKQEVEAGLTRLVQAARKAKLLAKTSVVIEPGIIPQWRQASKSALLVMWPNRPDHAIMAATLEQLNRGQTSKLVVLLRRIDRGAATKLRLLAKLVSTCTIAPLELIQCAGGKWQVQQFELGKVSSGEQVDGYWDKVAAKLRKHALEVLAVSNKGLFVAFAKHHVRLVAFDQVSPRCQCIELRINDENKFDAANQFAQLKQHGTVIEQGLKQQFEISWLADKVRANDQVLKLMYKQKDDTTPAEFGDAIALVHQVLQPPVASLEEFSW